MMKVELTCASGRWEPPRCVCCRVATDWRSYSVLLWCCYLLANLVAPPV